MGRKRSDDPTEREQQALDLEAEGLNYTEIAERLGVNKNRAKQLVEGGKHRKNYKPK